jgi:hypothetical protein
MGKLGTTNRTGAPRERVRWGFLGAVRFEPFEDGEWFDKLTTNG